MHRRLQFGMRENPASTRRHGSRQAVCGLSDANRTKEENVTSTPLTAAHANAASAPDAAPPRAATGSEKQGAIRYATLAKSTRTNVPIKGDFEPLISSCEAARLLGNIHVKTLQRYARLGRVPGYQIGGHWYFRQSELDAWLCHQINSNRQSVR